VLPPRLHEAPIGLRNSIDPLHVHSMQHASAFHHFRRTSGVFDAVQLTKLQTSSALWRQANSWPFCSRLSTPISADSVWRAICHSCDGNRGGANSHHTSLHLGCIRRKVGTRRRIFGVQISPAKFSYRINKPDPLQSAIKRVIE
jgi:hypothetical protein